MRRFEFETSCYRNIYTAELTASRIIITPLKFIFYFSSYEAREHQYAS